MVDGARLRHLMCQDGVVVKRPYEGAIHHITEIRNLLRKIYITLFESGQAIGIRPSPFLP